jgi:hypothetical protein
LLFTGDSRKVNVTISKATSFSNVSAKLMLGDQDVTSTYITSTVTSAGNMLISDVIGGKASLPDGTYRYFITATYGGKVRTWYWDVLVLPKDVSRLGEIPAGDYNPFVGDIVAYEGDQILKTLVLPAIFTAAVGLLTQLASDVTSTYCNGAVSATVDTLQTHLIGGVTTIPAGDYGYFLTATYNNLESVSTWFWNVKMIAKQSNS